MSILIKHLKMPPVGGSRTFVIDGNGDVHINGSLGHQRLVDYAVELPPHGRLADLDQMVEDYWDGNHMEIDEGDLKAISQYKVVIEAEGETDA